MDEPAEHRQAEIVGAHAAVEVPGGQRRDRQLVEEIDRLVRAAERREQAADDSSAVEAKNEELRTRLSMIWESTIRFSRSSMWRIQRRRYASMLRIRLCRPCSRSAHSP
jgi:hypothetical protein